MPQEIHVGDIGTVFQATLMDGAVPLDLSSADTLQLLFETALGAVVIKDAALTTNGEDGAIQYITEDATFLDSAGLWRWQCVVAMVGWSGHSDTATFQVHYNLG